jgi:hypothetical protein
VNAATVAVIEKVRKLRALSQSDNLHEAAAAASAAERLIQEHSLSEAALHVDASDEPVGSDDVDLPGAQIARWQSNLLWHLSKAYQIAGVFGVVRDALGRRAHRYKAHGRPQDLATLAYQYAYFTVEVERLAQKIGRGRGRTFLNSFRLGAVAAIGESLASVQTETRAAASSSALVVVDRRAELAKDALRRACPNIRTSKGGASAINGSAYALGKQAGAGLTQRSQIAAGGARLLGRG